MLVFEDSRVIMYVLRCMCCAVGLEPDLVVII